jgi:hypothetical protein
MRKEGECTPSDVEFDGKRSSEQREADFEGGGTPYVPELVHDNVACERVGDHEWRDGNLNDTKGRSLHHDSTPISSFNLRVVAG